MHEDFSLCQKDRLHLLFYYNLCRTKKFSQIVFFYLTILEQWKYFHYAHFSTQFPLNSFLIFTSLSLTMYVCQHKLALIWRSTSSYKKNTNLLKILFFTSSYTQNKHVKHILFVQWPKTILSHFLYFGRHMKVWLSFYYTLRKSNNFLFILFPLYFRIEPTFFFDFHMPIFLLLFLKFFVFFKENLICIFWVNSLKLIWDHL